MAFEGSEFPRVLDLKNLGSQGFCKRCNLGLDSKMDQVWFANGLGLVSIRFLFEFPNVPFSGDACLALGFQQFSHDFLKLCVP